MAAKTSGDAPDNGDAQATPPAAAPPPFGLA